MLDRFAGSVGDDGAAPEDDESVEDPMAGKHLAEMTPDDIESYTKPQWQQCLAARYKIKMPASTSKGDLVERAIQEEINRAKDALNDPSR
jgi:hypothetical protein